MFSKLLPLIFSKVEQPTVQARYYGDISSHQRETESVVCLLDTSSWLSVKLWIAVKFATSKALRVPLRVPSRSPLKGPEWAPKPP